MQKMTLGNKYASVIVGLLFCLTSNAQTQPDTSRSYGPPVNGKFYYPGSLKIGSQLQIPQDTFKMARADSGAIAYKGGGFYAWNGGYWSLLTAGTSSNLPQFNIKAVGADTTGTNDVSALIQSALNAGFKTIIAPKGNYKMTSTVQLKDGVTIIGEGRGATIFNTAANQPVFKVSLALGGNSSQFTDFSFYGNLGSGNTSQEGILIDSAYGVLIHNIGAANLSGYAFHIKRNGYCCGTYIATATRGNTISDCFVYNSYGGAKIDSVAEYNSVHSNIFQGCTYGIFNAGGNSRIDGNNCSNNTYGFYLTGGSNDAHGIVSNNTFNHNAVNVTITGVTRGMGFVNNTFARTNTGANGLCEIINSTNIHFIGSYFLVGDTIRTTNSTNIVFSDQYYWSGNPNVVVVSGDAPTIGGTGITKNSYSLNDLVNGKRMDITHLNNAVNFTGTSGIRWGFNNASPAASALVDITSTTQGLLIPRMTTTQQNAISSPANGLVIYNTDSSDLFVYKSSAWARAGASSSGGGGGSLTVGTSAISGGTSRSIFYDSSGILQENPLFSFNASKELLINNSTDLGSYNLQVTGPTLLKASADGTYVQRIESQNGVGYLQTYVDNSANIVTDCNNNYIARYSGNNVYVYNSGGFTFNSGNLSFPIAIRGTSDNYLIYTDASNNSVGIGTNSVAASAKLDVTSTTKGFLPPRMTTTQRNAISSPAEGLIVYDLTTHKHYGWDGTAWNAFY